MLRALLLLSLVGVLFAETVKYDGHKVVRVTPKTWKEYNDLEEYQQYLESHGIDIWRKSNGPDRPLDFRVSPAQTAILDELSLKHSVLIPDVEALIQYTFKKNFETTPLKDGDFNYGMYHKLSEIMEWMSMIVTKYSNIAQMFPIAKSYEGRQLNGIKISVNPRPGKPAVWFEGGIHAREWISPATVIYMTNQLLEQNNKDPDVTATLNAFDIYIVPVVNVDGYDYTWTTDRTWRKTRSKNAGSQCVGVDPNRNWNFHFCEDGASMDPCSESYCGPSAFSEKVVKGISDTILNTSNLVGFIDFHSYSQMWMTPWGFTKSLPKDVVQQNQSSAAAVAAIESVHGTKYTFGTIANIIYIASGSSADWTYGVANIKYSVGVELRDTGKFGFLLPPDQIIPSGQETIRGLLAYMDFIKNNM